MNLPPVTGVIETCIHVDDIERSMRFYRDIFGFEPLEHDARFCGFPVANGQMLLLFKKGASTQPIAFPGGIIPPHGGSGQLHLAFSIAAADYDPWRAWLEEKGIAIKSEVTWPRGGRSIYFRDPDQHLVELATPGVWAIY